MRDFETLIGHIEAIQQKINLGSTSAALDGRVHIEAVIAGLDSGKIRVAEKSGNDWKTNVWVKQAIMMYFGIMEIRDIEIGPFVYRDKIPLKRNYRELNVRVVPPAVARYGSFLETGVVLMPSYVNIGAYVGAGTMVDTWATVGSCAQIGSGVHLSGGVGIGGVLEPAQASPVIVEDGAFIGSRAIVVEGVRIHKEAVLAANVTLTASTPIIDLRGSSRTIIKGYVPERCVVVPGTLEKDAPHGTGKIHTQCAYIIGERKPSTDLKTSLNAALRDFSVSV
jgi:2,3,4,5-tetrahydropyridine-2,6-dicarboxylate N-succinyltransferase